MNAHRSVCWVCLGIVVVLMNVHAPAAAQQEQKTLQSFGVQAKHGQPVYPLPANVTLGLFNPDPLLDLAYYADGKVQVWQNLGNGTFGNEPVLEQRVSGEIQKLEFRKSRMFTETIFDQNSWADLFLTFANGSTEKISHEWMNIANKSFTSLPQSSSGFPPLNFTEKWRSERNIGLGTYSLVGDLDNDGKNEMVYMFFPSSLDSIYRLVVYKCVGNDSFVVDWDTTTTSIMGLFGITDVDNDGRKEIVTAYSKRREINVAPVVALFECYGPRRYRFHITNIGIERPLFKVLETDIDHDGVKELTVLTSDGNLLYDNTFIYVAEFVTKGPSPQSPSGWLMGFNQELARDDRYVTDLAVGQVDGVGHDEIVLGIGGSLGITEPLPVVYLWYNGVPGPFAWEAREIYTGLWSDAGAPMFVNLDADTIKEFVAGGAGPPGHGSMYAIKYLHDTTWSVLWADSSLRNGPIWVNSGPLENEFVVAGANTWRPTIDTTFSQFNVYYPGGIKRGLWALDGAMIQQFHLVDIDSDGGTNLIMARLGRGGSGDGRFLSDFELDSTTDVGDGDELPGEYTLSQNYPNPFNPSTTIVFSTPATSHIQLKVFNLIGQEVATLVNEKKMAGEYEAVWDASSLPSGVYFYRIQTENFRSTKKMILLR